MRYVFTKEQIETIIPYNAITCAYKPHEIVKKICEYYDLDINKCSNITVDDRITQSPLLIFDYDKTQSPIVITRDILIEDMKNLIRIRDYFKNMDNPIFGIAHDTINRIIDDFDIDDFDEKN